MNAAPPERLWHFTCSHGRRDIGSGPNCLLVPHPHPLLHAKLLWLTSQEHPSRDAVGLTSRYISCDRMRFRYVVTETQACHPWIGSPERLDAPQRVVADLESYGNPEHWWITDKPVRATFDRSWQP